MINYFDMLGGGNAANRALGVAGGLQNLQTNRQAMDIQRQQAAMQQQQGEQRNQQDLLTQSRLRLAEGAGAFRSSVESGNAQGALQIASQDADDIKRLDPSFTPEMVQKRMETEEGRQALIQQAQMMTQIAAGPEQSARFVAQQARPQSAQAEPARIAEFREWQRQNPDATSEQQRQVYNQMVLPQERAFATGQGSGQARVGTEQQLTPILAERAGAVAQAQELTPAKQAALARQRFEMQIKEEEQSLADRAREQKRQTDIADTRNSLLDIDNLVGTVNRILEVPQSVQRSATGPVASRLPTVRRSVADFEELINSFESQAFTAQVAKLKGMGALSDAEGRKLAAALGNISLRQSPEQIQRNLKIVLQIMDGARGNLIKKSGFTENELAPRQDVGVIDWSSL